MFNDSLKKIKRAEYHIAQLQAKIDDFCKTKFYEFRVEYDSNSAMNILKFKCTQETPEEIPLILGDAIHNLRSALDLLVCEVISAGGREPKPFVTFPFRKTRKELSDAINGGQLKATNPEVARVILDEIQPYPGGMSSELYEFHDLDIQDKHRLIIPLFGVTELNNVDCVSEEGIMMTNCTFEVGNGENFIR